MKVLISSEWYAPTVNGVVASVLNLERELKALGHEVRILTLAPGRRSYRAGAVTYLASLSAAFVYPQARLTWLPLRNPFLRELIEWRPDVVHSQCEFSTFRLARGVARACAAPLVHTYHTVYEDYTHYLCPSARLGKALARGLSRRVLNRCAAVVAPTEKVRALLQGYRVRAPIAVIPTGIDLTRFAARGSAEEISALRARCAVPAGGLPLVYVGRLAREKNLEEIFALLAELRELPLFLSVVGGGPYLPVLKNRVRELGLEERVRFTGMIAPAEVARYYGLGELFVSASQSETQGLTYIEALAAGTPALCKRDACLDGVIREGVNGWQYGDAAEFEARIRALLDDPARLAVLKANVGTAAVEEWSARTFARRVAGLYEEALGALRDSAGARGLG